MHQETCSLYTCDELTLCLQCPLTVFVQRLACDTWKVVCLFVCMMGVFFESAQNIQRISSNLIYPLTARVVGAPQVISQPVSSIFPILHCHLGLGELQACPFPDVFPPLPLSALSSSPFHRALQDGFGQTWRTGNMTIPLQFASLCYGQEICVWSDCLLDLGTHFLVGNMIFVWDA